jgi:hypothetical protein
MVSIVFAGHGGEEDTQRGLRELVPEFVEVDLLRPEKN